MASNKEILSNILDEVVALRKEVADLKSAKAPMGSAPKTRKPRDPDAPPKAPNAWIIFTGKVRTVLKEAGLPAGKECQQFASHLKATVPNAYEMDEADILAEHPKWTPPPPKPKEDKEEAEEPKPKPKRTLSDEQKAKMAAGRKAAAERRKAEAAAKAAEDGEAEELEEEAEEAKPPSPKAKAPPAAPKADLKPFPFKGKKMLLDPTTNGVWLKEEDGSKGAWQGVLSKDKKSIDASVEEPEE